MSNVIIDLDITCKSKLLAFRLRNPKSHETLTIDNEDKLLFCDRREHITEITIKSLNRNLGFLLEWFPNLKRLNVSGIMPKDLFLNVNLKKCHYLDCSMSSCNSLPQLPWARKVICYGNKIHTIPQLNNCSYIDCHNNSILYMPSLPECLYLYCYGNKGLTHDKLTIPKCIEAVVD